jgi:hypothetical protein
MDSKRNTPSAPVQQSAQAFRHKETHEIRYALDSRTHTEDEWEDVVITPTSPLPDKNDQTEGETESLSEPFGTLVIYQDGTEVFKRAGEPFPPTAYGYVAIELFSHPKPPQLDSNELVEALRRLEVSANTVDYCYRSNPGNFASALSGLVESADGARVALSQYDKKEG